MMATRYQVWVTRLRLPTAYGVANDVLSVQLFDRSVTASAMTDVAACAPSNPSLAALALKSPWMYTGFSDTTVSPFTLFPTMLEPSMSFKARRKTMARLVCASLRMRFLVGVLNAL